MQSHVNSGKKISGNPVTLSAAPLLAPIVSTVVITKPFWLFNSIPGQSFAISASSCLTFKLAIHLQSISNTTTSLTHPTPAKLALDGITASQWAFTCSK